MTEDEALAKRVTWLEDENKLLRRSVFYSLCFTGIAFVFGVVAVIRTIG